MLDWISYLLGYKTINKNENKKKPFINPSDLQAVVLKKNNLPINNKKYKKPAFARNAPNNSFHLLRLTNNQLKEILEVKLKPIKKSNNNKKWESRHPVLKELQKTVPIKY